MGVAGIGMDEDIDRASAGLAVAILLAAAAVALPWWTVTGSVGGLEGTTTAGAFDTGDGVLETWEAVVAGVLTLLALAGLAFTGVVAWDLASLEDRWRERAAPAAAVAGALLLVGALLAVVTWPGEGAGFWDEDRVEGFGGSVASETAAGLGWYAAVLAGILGPAAAVDGRKRGLLPGGEEEEEEQEEQEAAEGS